MGRSEALGALFDNQRRKSLGIGFVLGKNGDGVGDMRVGDETFAAGNDKVAAVLDIGGPPARWVRSAGRFGDGY